MHGEATSAAPQRPGARARSTHGNFEIFIYVIPFPIPQSFGPLEGSLTPVWAYSCNRKPRTCTTPNTVIVNINAKPSTLI